MKSLDEITKTGTKLFQKVNGRNFHSIAVKYLLYTNTKRQRKLILHLAVQTYKLLKINLYDVVRRKRLTSFYL